MLFHIDNFLCWRDCKFNKNIILKLEKKLCLKKKRRKKRKTRTQEKNISSSKPTYLILVTETFSCPAYLPTPVLLPSSSNAAFTSVPVAS